MVSEKEGRVGSAIGERRVELEMREGGEKARLEEEAVWWRVEVAVSAEVAVRAAFAMIKVQNITDGQGSAIWAYCLRGGEMNRRSAEGPPFGCDYFTSFVFPELQNLKT